MDTKETKYLKVAGVVFLSVASLAMLAFGARAVFSGGEYGYKGENRPTITVSGKGEAMAVPDIATFTFSVTESATTVKAAQDKATQKMNSVLAKVKGLGVAEKDVKTSSYNIYPKYEYQSSPCPAGAMCPIGGKQILTGYEVSQSIEVKVRDTAKAGDVLAAVGALGVQNVSGLNLTVDNEDAVIADARKKAIEDAKAKAEILAKDLGVKLGKVQSFNENGQMPVPMYDRAAGFGMEASSAKSVAPELPTGENKYTSNVTIVYEIR